MGAAGVDLTCHVGGDLQCDVLRIWFPLAVRSLGLVTGSRPGAFQRWWYDRGARRGAGNASVEQYFRARRGRRVGEIGMAQVRKNTSYV